jgi:uncharacterized membrane protein
MIDLGTGGGPFSMAYGINDSGASVGETAFDASASYWGAMNGTEEALSALSRFVGSKILERIENEGGYDDRFP